MKAMLKWTMAAAMIACVTVAQAQNVLNVGSEVFVPNVSKPNLTLVDFQDQAFTASTFSGHLLSWVYKSDLTGDNLIFAWGICLSPDSKSAVGRITFDDWAGSSAIVAQHSALGVWDNNGKPVTTSDRFNPDVLGFNFNKVGPDALSANTNSTIFWALSDQTSYTTNNAYLIDGSIVQTCSFAPVPEPGSMIALGAGALALLARRRRKA